MIILQSYHWYTKNDGKLWIKLRKRIPQFKEMGISHIWLPPPTRAKRGLCPTENDPIQPKHIKEYINSFLPDVGEVGYSILSLFDLNNTKYGNEVDFRQLVNELNQANIVAVVDSVLNHRTGVVPINYESKYYECDLFDTQNRNEKIGEASVKFPVYLEKLPNDEILYIDGMYYNSIGYCPNSIAKIKGKEWSNNVSMEFGNYDHLLGVNMDLNSEYTKSLYKKWFTWMIEEYHIGGFRIDALKHMDHVVVVELIEFTKKIKEDVFFLCEVWNGDETILRNYEKSLKANIFNVNQHYRFYESSKKGNQYDLRNIISPFKGIPFVDNHDTQPSQDLESFVDGWFKLSAYTILLLRNTNPVIFIADYDGALYNSTDKDTKRGKYPIAIPKLKYHLDIILKIRKEGFVLKKDYFDHPNCIGWVSNKFVVILNNDTADWKLWMKANPKTKYMDALFFRSEIITTDHEGNGEFISNSGTVSVWVPISDTQTSFIQHETIEENNHKNSQIAI